MKHVFGENPCRDLGFLSVHPIKTHACVKELVYSGYLTSALNYFLKTAG